ncbi:hypothetical protein NFI96_033579 [Prochilodus magdalenae]|nr:hypothetical protein NFI96_033579 [Prochilodus magdalenae]
MFPGKSPAIPEGQGQCGPDPAGMPEHHEEEDQTESPDCGAAGISYPERMGKNSTPTAAFRTLRPQTSEQCGEGLTGEDSDPTFTKTFQPSAPQVLSSPAPQQAEKEREGERGRGGRRGSFNTFLQDYTQTSSRSSAMEPEEKKNRFVREGLVVLSVREGLVVLSVREGLVVLSVREGLVVLSVREGLVVLSVREGLVVLSVREGLVVLSVREGLVVLSVREGLVVLSVREGLVVLSVREGLVVLSVREGLVVLSVREGPVVLSVREGLVVLSVREGLVVLSVREGPVMIASYLAKAELRLHFIWAAHSRNRNMRWDPRAFDPNFKGPIHNRAIQPSASCGAASCGAVSCGAASCGQRPVGSVLWGSVLGAASCGAASCGAASCGAASCGQRPVGQRPGGSVLWGSVLGAASWGQRPVGQRPVGQRPVSTDEGLEGCTDVLCCLLFILALLGYFAVGILAWSQGDPRKVIYPTDSRGEFCGQAGTPLENKPLLFYFNIMKCASPLVLLEFQCPTTQICVEKCPERFLTLLKAKRNPDDWQYYTQFCKEGVDSARVS